MDWDNHDPETEPMRLTKALPLAAAAAALLGAIAAPALAAQPDPGSAPADTSQPASTEGGSTFSQDEVVVAASNFFGVASSRVAGAVERIFAEQGEPVGYIQGSEIAGAIGAGVRYGKGTLVMRTGEEREVFWQGPSIGFDTGGNASRVFTLVYDLGNPDGIYRRYPGVEGAAFFVAGISVTYQRAEGVTLAPMRTGVGLRAGVNAGYTAYSAERRWLPF